MVDDPGIDDRILEASLGKGRDQLIEEVGRGLREMMPWLRREAAGEGAPDGS